MNRPGSAGVPPAPDVEDRRGRPARAPRTGFGLLVLLAVLAVGVGCRPVASSLPQLGAMPEFSLVDQRGQPASSADLAGKVVVANFVFTTCTDICPALTATMGRVRDELKQARLLDGKTVLVSFSVDPEQDTPVALAEYGARFGADPAHWRFLTGDRGEIDRLLTTGFKVGAPPPAVSTDGRREVIHTNRFVVIDPRGQIRWYPRGDEFDIGQLVEEVRRLAA